MYYAKPEKPGHHASAIATGDVQYVTTVLSAVLDDAFNLLPSYRSTDLARDKATLQRRLNCEGLTFATVVLPYFFNEVLSKLEGREPSFRGFKINPQSRLPVFLGGLLDMVFNQGTQDTTALGMLYALCVAFKKLKGEYPKHVLSDELDKFIDTDKSLQCKNFGNQVTNPIIRRAKGYIDTLFNEIDIDDIIPKPGPGAVNTALKPYLRYQPHVRYEQLDSVFPYRNWFYSNAFGLRESVGNYFRLAKAEYPTSRFKFVPKYANKPRGICIEENETQYLQQGLKHLLYKKIQSHPMTKGRVNFESQDVNRDLALKSSFDMSYNTIDMSEASDRIPRDLVFMLFKDTPLLEYLDALSTRVIEYPDDVRSGCLLANKFAPMGSAICFPIMAVVHFALCKAIIATSGMKNARKASKQIFVYGDDILTPSEFTELIFTELPRFGMKINVEKSYVKSSFRESCGIHAYKGVDITPVYNNYTLNHNHERKDSTRLLSCLAKEYLYHKKGMVETAAVVRKHIRKVYGQLPFGQPTSRLLCFKRDALHYIHQKMYAERKRYNAEYQRWEYYMPIVVPRFIGQLSLLGAPALLRWFNQHLEKDSARFMDYDSQKIVKRWIPESDLG